MTVLVIESQTNQRLFEGLAVFVGEFLFLLFLYDTFSLVCQCAEDVGRCLLPPDIFSHSLVMHIAPLPSVLPTAHVPAENALSCLDIFSDKTDQEIAIELMILRMNELKTFFVTHSLLRQQIPMQVISVALAQIES